MSVDHARDVWETLKKIHQSDNRARLKGLPAEFMRFRLDASIDEGASKLTRLQSKIGKIDADSRPSDPIKIEALLAGLGPEYEATLAAIDASGSASFEETVSRLKRVELRLKGPQDQNLAQMTQDKKKEGPCYNCGKMGHLKRQCKKPIKESQEDSEGDAPQRRNIGSSHEGGEELCPPSDPRRP